MLFPHYQDKHTHSADGYACTNEETEILIQMIGNKRPNRVGAIASGGEIALGALLPQTVYQLVAIDHSYRSIICFWLKFMLMHEMSAKGFRDIILNGPPADLRVKVLEVAEHLPENLRTWMTTASSNYGTPRTVASWIDYHFLAPSSLSQFKSEWERVPEARLLRAVKKLQLVHLIHGDFPRDMGEFGKFDLLYISNMFEHTGRGHKAPTLNDLAPLLNKGGRVLTTTTGAPRVGNEVWSVENFTPSTRRASYNWKYQLLTKLTE